MEPSGKDTSVDRLPIRRRFAPKAVLLHGGSSTDQGHWVVERCATGRLIVLDDDHARGRADEQAAIVIMEHEAHTPGADAGWEGAEYLLGLQTKLRRLNAAQCAERVDSCWPRQTSTDWDVSFSRIVNAQALVHRLRGGMRSSKPFSGKPQAETVNEPPDSQEGIGNGVDKDKLASWTTKVQSILSLNVDGTDFKELGLKACETGGDQPVQDNELPVLQPRIDACPLAISMFCDTALNGRDIPNETTIRFVMPKAMNVHMASQRRRRQIRSEYRCADDLYAALQHWVRWKKSDAKNAGLTAGYVHGPLQHGGVPKDLFRGKLALHNTGGVHETQSMVHARILKRIQEWCEADDIDHVIDRLESNTVLLNNAWNQTQYVTFTPVYDEEVAKSLITRINNGRIMLGDSERPVAATGVGNLAFCATCRELGHATGVCVRISVRVDYRVPCSIPLLETLKTLTSATSAYHGSAKRPNSAPKAGRLLRSRQRTARLGLWRFCSMYNGG